MFYTELSLKSWTLTTWYRLTDNLLKLKPTFSSAFLYFNMTESLLHILATISIEF